MKRRAYCDQDEHSRTRISIVASLGGAKPYRPSSGRNQTLASRGSGRPVESTALIVMRASRASTAAKSIPIVSDPQ